MKEKMTFYEILEVPPNASPADIRAAYRQLQSIYDSESLSTYSLFSSTERKTILDQAENAFSTLTDTVKRDVYDRHLMEQGRLTKEMRFINAPRGPTPIFPSKGSGNSSRALQQIKEKTGRNDVKAMRDNLMAGKPISGPQLKALRRAAGISLTDIFEASRVSVTTLEAIEGEDRGKLPPRIYLKGFLKSYAECLGLDPDLLVSGYMS